MLKRLINKITFIMVLVIFCTVLLTGVYAASSSITASKTTATVGDSVKITVKITAAAWNVKVSGSGISDSIVGFNMEAENETTTKTYTLKPSSAGTYTVSISGDITDSSDANSGVNKSVTVKFNEKTSTSNNSGSSNTSTTVQKSSNANISKLTLNVEGLSFNKNQTTYNIKVGENVNNISVGVTLESSKATYTVSGNKNLKVGNNVIKIVVTAENGTKKTYSINVEKTGNVEETSAKLSNLIIENMTFTVPFNSEVKEYDGGTIKYTKSLNVLPYTLAEEATYVVIGNNNLKAGQNEVIVKVTSKDGSNTEEYKIKFVMQEKEENNALQTVSPYVEKTPNSNEDFNWCTNLWNVVKENATVLLLYALALVEFVQVVYLYTELKKVSPDVVETKRRKGNKEKENK